MELKSKKLVFVGAGNMAEALVRGILKANLVEKENLLVTDVNLKRLEFFNQALGVKGVSNNKEAVLLSEVIVLSIKPQMMKNVLDEIAGVVQPGQKVISIAAGITTKFIESKLTKEIPVIRVMPNTPALIGHGMAGISAGKYVQDEDMELARVIFEAVGKVVVVKEEQMDTVTALSGSGPAYFFTIVEILAEAGVSLGLPEEISLKLAIETMEGAAKMLKETNEHPTILRNKVTSPGGTTMAALNVLDEKGFRKTFLEAVTAAAKRSKELSIIN